MRILSNISFNVYSIDGFEEDVEILANKSELDGLLLKEQEFITNNSFGPDGGGGGETIVTEFGTIYSKSDYASVKAVHGVGKDVYQYETQLGSNGPMYIGWATKECVFDNTSGVGIFRLPHDTD